MHVPGLARRHHTPWPELDHGQAPFKTYPHPPTLPQTSAKHSDTPFYSSASLSQIVRQDILPPHCPAIPLSDSPLQQSHDFITSFWLRIADPRLLDTSFIMSGWGLGWFGGGQAKKEAPKRAILQLRGQLEMLSKREKHLRNQMDEQDTIARKYVSSNKAGRFPCHDVVAVADRTDSGQGSITAEEAVRALS